MSTVRPLARGPLLRLQNRYELLDEVPPASGGRLFRARDLAFAETVGVKQLGGGCGLSVEDRRHLENMVRHLQCLQHPNLLRIYALDGAAGLLIQEWVHGISLLDLLRRRRELRAPEALRLLASLPAVLDFLAREAVPTPRPLLGKLLIQFENSVAPEAVTALPVDQWPPFILKVNALSVRGFVPPAAADDTTMHFAVPDPREPGDISDSYGPREFARLLYELLGGRIRELDARRYSPIGSLREAGNAVLRRTLIGMPPVDCQALWHQLMEAQPELDRAPLPAASPTLPAARALRMPAALAGPGEPATVLHLQPEDARDTPVILVARRRFNIGRSPQQADFLARVLPENEANNALTNRLSRIHSILEITPEGIEVRDGNGFGPSLNGSFLDGQRLHPDPAAPFAGRSLLWLGQEYALELVHVYAAPSRPLLIENLEAAEARPAAEPHGALVCLHANGQPAARHTAWLFSEAGFGLDAAEQLVWDTRGRHESPAAFHYHRGAFWLRNRALPETALACDDTPLQRDEIAPLRRDQRVRMGSHTFTVQLE